METLAELYRQQQVVIDEMTNETKRHDRACSHMDDELRAVREAIQGQRAGLDTDKITEALEVLEIDGSWERRGEDGAGAVAAAINELATYGGRELYSHRFAVKDYDRWVGQRCDTSYGMCPRHGSVVFAVGLKRNIRMRPGKTTTKLTEAEIEVALYYLSNIEEISKAELAANPA